MDDNIKNAEDALLKDVMDLNGMSDENLMKEVDTASAPTPERGIEKCTQFLGIYGCTSFIKYIRTIADKSDFIEQEYNKIIVKLIGELGEKYIGYIVDKDFEQEKRLYCLKIFIDALTSGEKLETCISIVENSFGIYDMIYAHAVDGDTFGNSFDNGFDDSLAESFKEYAESDIKKATGYYNSKKSYKERDYTNIKRKKKSGKRRLKVRR